MVERPLATPAELLAYLDELGLETTTVDHHAVYTVEEARQLRGSLPGSHSKSLFLRNKKKQMWLVTAEADRQIDLRRLGESLGAGRVGFGSPERLMSYLGVIPGAVSPFGVINDVEGVVRVALDREMLEHEPLNLHPLDNTKTTSIGREDLLRFLRATGHEPLLLEPEAF
jgi:Ala-tRNA(Pro) deacylase